MSETRAPARGSGVAVGQVVVATFEGTGKVWPSGTHRRSGRVLKHGPAGGWLIQTFASIPERVDGEWVDSHVITCNDHELQVIE